MHFVRLARPVAARPNRTGLFLALAAAVLLLAATARAQFAPPAGTQVHDTSVLHPPAGARVAIVEFEDMECPVCGNVNPLLKKAVANYNIPWTRYDFPLPQHAWSMSAAIYARWFDTKSKALGDEYRDYVFASQGSLYNNSDLLRQLTEKFAQSHGIQLPFAIDPQGTLSSKVNADKALGLRIGINHTPTIWVVTSNSKAPFIEVLHPDQQLYSIIDQALADTKPAVARKPAKAPAPKPAGN